MSKQSKIHFTGCRKIDISIESDQLGSMDDQLKEIADRLGDIAQSLPPGAKLTIEVTDRAGKYRNFNPSKIGL